MFFVTYSEDSLNGSLFPSADSLNVSLFPSEDSLHVFYFPSEGSLNVSLFPSEDSLNVNTNGAVTSLMGMPSNPTEQLTRKQKNR